MLQIGTIIGRLSDKIDGKIQAFPTKSWRNEFEIAKKCEFNVLEWIIDESQNPILTEDGINEIACLSKKYNIKINSICCDNFMINPFFNISEFMLGKNSEMMKILINACYKLDIQFLEIPLVDKSSIKTKNEENEITENLEKFIPLCEKNNVYLTLETDLEPKKFKELLLRFNHPNVVANYDTGNSASLGYNVESELFELKNWIRNIHIKDRVFGGKTVELGKGNTDFELFFKTLKKIEYSGDLILQGARLDEYLSPQDTGLKYKRFVKQYLDKYSL